MFYDATYLLVAIGAIICMIASARVKAVYSKYSKVRSATGLTGAQAASKMLAAAGIYDVTIRHVSGNLTDNYNSSNKTLNLSDSVYDSTSVAAIGVACHECGHAIQDQVKYVPLTFRHMFVPVANFGSKLAWPVFLVGLFINNEAGLFLLQAGIFLFILAVLFHIITLPVEFNASGRALTQMEALGFLGNDELKMAKKVLKAAALTYVASAFSALLQLLRLVLLANRRRD